MPNHQNVPSIQKLDNATKAVKKAIEKDGGNAKVSSIRNGLAKAFGFASWQAFLKKSEPQQTAPKITCETYSCIALSTGHITKKDAQTVLPALIAEGDSMIMEREYGFFIKLYEELEDNLDRTGVSEGFNNVIKFAHKHGARMVELDCDAPYEDSLPTFDW